MPESKSHLELIIPEAVAVIADDSITNAQLIEVPANTVKANTTGSTANPSDITKANFKTWLGVSNSISGVVQIPADDALDHVLVPRGSGGIITLKVYNNFDNHFILRAHVYADNGSWYITSDTDVWPSSQQGVGRIRFTGLRILGFTFRQFDIAVVGTNIVAGWDAMSNDPNVLINVYFNYTTIN